MTPPRSPRRPRGLDPPVLPDDGGPLYPARVKLREVLGWLEAIRESEAEGGG